MSELNPKVDAFLARASQWQAEFTELRRMVLASGLTEELKWGVPCYALGKSNVVLMHGFKDYCALLFVKGALLADPGGLLVQQTENVQSARQIRFTSLDQIVELEPAIKAYLAAAIGVEQAGLKVEFKKTTEFAVTPEFQQRLEASPELKAAFQALTPGRQRAYLLFFAAPKQAQTRQARIEKSLPQIMAGKGLND
jgi:uncharacterized protein YdeI (YjbR/CyaY-like superfamily)